MDLSPQCMICLLMFFLFFQVSVEARKAKENNRRIARQVSNQPLVRPFRQVPLCVDEENKIPEEEGLTRFEWIFDFYKYNTYIPVQEGPTSPSGMIVKFELSPIRIDDKNSGYQDILKNWVHIYLESAVELEGLYVQAISVPWGVPFGEFVASFNCRDCVGHKTSEYKNDIHIVPCSKRPALAFTHPNVFTVGGDPINVELEMGRRKYFDHMHFNFKYTQYPCVDHSYVQFLIIAVRSFKGNFSRFETYFSKIYELDVSDNPIGAYYPFYGAWDEPEIQCHTGDQLKDFQPWPGSNKKLKVRYSQRFDGCLIDDDDEHLAWYTCPPGPISISDPDIPTDLTEWIEYRKKFALKGDPSLDPKYGDSAFFCPDAGTWEWTPGQLNWTLPPDIEVVIENGTVGLNVTIEGEKPTDVINGSFNCYESDGKRHCQPNARKDEQDCKDYQVSLVCDKDNLVKNKNFTPLYGKRRSDGKYISADYYCDDLTFTQQVDVVGIAWGHKYVLILHGKLMIFAWTVSWNIIVFIARFLKEYTVIERRSSYFGIGKWLWYHIVWTYVAGTAMLAGTYLMAHQHQTKRKELGTDDPAIDNLHDVCNLHTDLDETSHCLSTDRKVHNRIGVAAMFFFVLSFVSAWGRPLHRFLRLLLVWYHLAMAYIGKGLFYLIMGLGYLSTAHVIHAKTVLAVLVTDASSLVMFGVATFANCVIDRRFGIRGRRYFPVPEAIETYDVPLRMQRFICLMLPIHIIIQLLCYFVILGTFENPASETMCREEI